MRKLRNTLYITQELCYLFREGENVVAKVEQKEIGRFPIHILENIVCFNYNGVSPGLIRLCNDNGVSLAFISPQGFYQGRFVGKTNGNVLLRRQQYRIADEEEKALPYAQNMIYGKLANHRKMIKKAINDYKNRLSLEDLKGLTKGEEGLMASLTAVEKATSLDSLRGIEGDAARTYFGCFNQMIVQQKEDFTFLGRSKRPPLDRVNALLSFGYTLLTNEVQSALETVGLDSYVGFFHTDRPGRCSLALDMVEELRGYMVDRFALRLINQKEIKKKDFEEKENGAVLLNDQGRATVITKWQERKQEKTIHPFLEETMELGLLPYVQAQLLARTIREDVNSYPPFLL